MADIYRPVFSRVKAMRHVWQLSPQIATFAAVWLVTSGTAKHSELLPLITRCLLRVGSGALEFEIRIVVFGMCNGQNL